MVCIDNYVLLYKINIYFLKIERRNPDLSSDLSNALNLDRVIIGIHLRIMCGEVMML